MFDLKLSEFISFKKPIDEMSHDEYMQFINDEYETERDVLDEAHDLDKACTCLLNKVATIECRKQIPVDPLWARYSVEAWTLNETVKKILDKFEEFFPKVFKYINSFTIIGVKTYRAQCEKWLVSISDQNKDQDKIDKIFSNTDAKTANVESVILALDSAASAYSKLSDRANSIKGFKGVGKSDADAKKLQELFIMPEEYQTFLDNKKKVDDATASTGNAIGVTYKNGNWDDPSKIGKLCKALENVSSVLENVKRLQAICEEMVRDLRKEQKGEAADQNLIKQLNEQKIKFLKELCDKILSKMMGSIGNLGSLASKNCRTFCNQYSKDSEG